MFLAGELCQQFVKMENQLINNFMGVPITEIQALNTIQPVKTQWLEFLILVKPWHNIAQSKCRKECEETKKKFETKKKNTKIRNKPYIVVVIVLLTTNRLVRLNDYGQASDISHW